MLNEILNMGFVLNALFIFYFVDSKVCVPDFLYLLVTWLLFIIVWEMNCWEMALKSKKKWPKAKSGNLTKKHGSQLDDS